jgi:beta-lactamase class A
MPAASTIKVPVMVEVFEQMSKGRVSLNQTVHLMASVRDWGWGELCDAPLGSGYTVSTLLWKMITQSDNTATNMLIRLVGRQSINVTMHGLGLTNTHVADYIRSEGDIRSLRSSAADMAHLLDAIARDQLIDPWSSRQMMLILEGQTHNGLLPVPLPHDLKIAHKTGELHDTLNDVGIVEDDREPYIIAVMTTALPTLDIGRSFIQGVSKLTYNAMEQFASWREETGLAPVDRFVRPSDSAATAPLSPDLRMWLPADAKADSSKDEGPGAD